MSGNILFPGPAASLTNAFVAYGTADLAPGQPNIITGQLFDQQGGFPVSAWMKVIQRDDGRWMIAFHSAPSGDTTYRLQVLLDNVQIDEKFDLSFPPLSGTGVAIFHPADDEVIHKDFWAYGQVTSNSPLASAKIDGDAGTIVENVNMPGSPGFWIAEFTGANLNENAEFVAEQADGNNDTTSGIKVRNLA